MLFCFVNVNALKKPRPFSHMCTLIDCDSEVALLQYFFSFWLFLHFSLLKTFISRYSLIFSNDLTRPLLNCELHLVSGQLLLQTSLSDQLGMDL